MKSIDDILELADKRLAEAEFLVDKFPSGAYYLAGYAAELTLKARICKLLDFDNFYSVKQPIKRGSDAFFTHELTQLLTLSGLRKRLEDEIDREKGANSELAINWQLICNWNESRRYDLSIEKPEALDLLNALTNDKTGFLPWIRKNW
ncbi:hypothetical protein [Spirosoma rhododendri]|uniref:HEPN domain-containing protein n=1 Tax=Spirosoma rhododendri TaxID=2728024 RepID=A0A7L5DKP9_9BACT|nr:hypothetical protein [Spirosoma rhododendri]QJD78092.1 hypothetical protein HH216_06410 [Spirosoma rhododendri]